MKFFKCAAVTILAALSCNAQAQAKEFPTRAITLIIPFPPGGSVDIVGRLVAEKMGAVLKQPFVVENRTGAGGVVGASYVARAKADGYTLLLGGPASFVQAPVLHPKLPYDPISSFEPVGQASNGPLVVVVDKNSKAKNLPMLIQELKAKGNNANYGSNGNGTLPHLTGDLFREAAHLDMVHVPYSGGPAVITALLSGEVDMSIQNIPGVQSMITAGRLRALATTGNTRAGALPDLPTLREAGFKDFEANAWLGIFAPAHTPPAVVETLSKALEDAIKDPDLRKRMLLTGDEAIYRTPKDFAAFVAKQALRWRPIIEQANVTSMNK